MLSISPPTAPAADKTPPGEELPVLSLTHFSRPPFVSFGNVRPGTSRSCRLLVHNPNPEPAQLTVQRLDEKRGFTAAHRDLLIPPSETLPLTITWTPLEEGAVRELVTFVVNDVVKHQAVLLGLAEDKKKNLRGNRAAVKKRDVILGHKAPSLNRKEFAIKGKNKVVDATKNNVRGKPERVRSPLLSRENLALPRKHTAPENEESGAENRTPVHHQSPLAENLQMLSPGSLRRSKTYSVLCVTECTETLEEVTTTMVQTKLHIDEDWTFTDNRTKKRSMSPINPGHNQPLNITCTPGVSTLSPACRALSPTEFYNAEMARLGLSRHNDLNVDLGSCKESLQENASVVSSSTSSPPTIFLTPQTPTSSLESLLRVGHVSDKVQLTPFLSPDQFVKENCITLQSVSPYELSLRSTSLTPSKDSMSSITQEEGRTWQLVNGHVDLKISSDVEEEQINSRLTYCVKKKRGEIINLEEASRNEPKKLPIACATVVKVKGTDREGNPSRPVLKSRRRLSSSELEKADRPSFRAFQSLPIISSEPNDLVEPKNGLPPTSGSSRKRKSADFTSVTDLVGPCVDSLAQSKKINLSKPNIAPHVGNPRKPSHRKSADVVLPHQSTAKFNVKRVVAVAQSRLSFVKPSKTVIPRHPMPFAAKNMFYDERWMAKQERGFTWWLNFILTPETFAVNKDSTKVNAAALILGEESSHKMSVPKAPTKEEVSFKAYTARCRLNRLRRAACRLFTSEPVVRAIRRLEVEIEARRLLVRKDRHLWKDVGERQKVLNWLLSYNPLWLRVGLETIFGELIALESNSDVTGLAVFILNRLLWNPDIAAEYRHPSVPNLYRDGHEDALSKFTLKKLMLLVFFLDHAKQSRLIDHDPCLFWKDAEFKTSKDLLLAFSRDFLSGEGDLSRHLGYLGLPVSHSQTPLDEFDFAVTNLAVDLHCGIRLVRMMELLTQNWSLSRKLRVPAISRLQKMYNVELGLQVLTERGVQLKDERGTLIASKDIVDRHRERTLALLWKIVFSFQVDVLLNIEQLKEEIGFLKHSYNVQKKLAALRSFTSTDTVKKRESDAFAPENYNERVLLLMEWVNAVCAFYSTKVENFTVCFSDGRILCYLINHYHPSYLPLHAVCQRTTQTTECAESGTLGLNSSSDSENSLDLWPGMCDQGFAASALYKELLENEKMNYSLIHTAVSDLGGIPAMIHHSDMSNTIPDEKIVITYLSFLCARLLDLRKEARAARVIQAAWRKYRLKAEEQLQQRKHKAACVIKAAILRFVKCRRIKKTCAAVVVQKYWRRCQARRKLKMLKEQRMRERRAVIIQRYWRGYVARKNYLKIRHYIVLLQAEVRAKIAVASYRRVLWATRTIQTRLRSWLLARESRKRHLQLKSATIVIQSAFRKRKLRRLQRETEAVLVLQNAFRRWWARKRHAQHKAAITIQTLYRMHRDRQKYLEIRRKMIKLQAWFRCKRQRRDFLSRQRAALTLQTYYRAFKQGRMERECYLHKRSAAISIQMWFRSVKQCRLQRELYCKTTKAIVSLQAACRGWKVRKLQKYRLAAIRIQSEFRRFVCQSKLRSMKAAAVTIQRRYRAMLAGRKERRHYLKLREVVINVQAVWRNKALRANQRRINAAILIQSYLRMNVCRSKYNAMKQACKVIQQRYKAYREAKSQRLLYLTVKRATVTLQAAYRGWNVRRQVGSLHKAASIIQAHYRSYRLRKEYVKMRGAALCIQRCYRARATVKLARVEYMRLKTVAIKLQSCYRGRKVRLEIIQMQRSVVIIQSWYRMHRMHARYRKVKAAAACIQQRYRAAQERRWVQKHYQSLKKAACVLQATWRGRKVRQDIQSMHKAATVIQSQYRMLTQLRHYEELKEATITMQRRYRASKLRNNQVEQYQSIWGSVLCIQAAFRGMQTRRELKKRQEAATVIQRVFKVHLERQRFLALRGAAIVIQQRYRMKVSANLQRSEYVRFRHAVVVLQAACRGLAERRKIRHMHVSATAIQAAFRMYKVRVGYQAMKHASVIIQRWYRARRVSTHERQLFLKRCQSAAIIQAAYRGARERQKLRRMNQAASKIQAVFRMHRCRDGYKKLQWAVGVIQSRYRANKMRDFEVMRYAFMKESVVCIQAAYRAWKARKQERISNEAAAVIQRHFRTYVERKRYLSTKAAVTVIQRWYRGAVLTREHRRRFQEVLKATLCIQASFRGFKVRELELKQEMATRIQSAFRMHRSRASYRAMKSSVSVIQARYRSIALCRRSRTSYLELRQSAIRFQAVYRGVRIRKEVKTMHSAATVIQSSYRMHRQRNRYEHILQATRQIQQRFRATRARNSILQRYQNTRKATVLLQAAFRGMRVRQMIHKNHQSAVLIQRCFKCYVQRKTYTELRCATIHIQRRYKAVLLGRSLRGEFLACRRATVCIQAAYRRFKERKKLAQRHQAVTKIQSVFRMHRLYVQYQSLKLAAASMQRCYRRSIVAKRARANYLQHCKAAKVIQAAYRGFRTRRNLKCMHNAATIIQACYRMHTRRKRFLALQEAVRTVQRRFRANQAMENTRKEYRTIRNAVKRIQMAFRARKSAQEARRSMAAKVIQSEWKMYRARRAFVKIKAAAVLIQASFRGFRTRTWLKEKQKAACLIQRWYRSSHATRLQRMNYVTMRQAAVTIQLAFRGWRARQLAQKRRAATKVQSVIRMVACRKRFLRLRAAALSLQSYYRMHRTMYLYKMKRKAVLTIQRWYRSLLILKHQRENYQQIHRSVVRLQAAVRGHCSRRKLGRMASSAVKIQARWRGFIYRRRFLQQKTSVLIIQRRYRAACIQRTQRDEYLKLKTAAIKLQAIYRGSRVRRLVSRERAACAIQTSYRCYTVRRDYITLIRTVRTMQRHVRVKQERARFLKTQRAVVYIQRRWRETITAKTTRHMFLQKRAAALALQSAFRGHVVRREMKKKRDAACRLQAAYRGYLCRRYLKKLKAAALSVQIRFRAHLKGRRERLEYERVKACVVRLQAYTRGWLLRNEVVYLQRAAHLQRFASVAQQHLCALTIQRRFRLYLALRRARSQICQVICIQRWFRSKLQHRTYLISRGQVVLLQRAVRVWLRRRNEAACKIQRCVRDFLLRRKRDRVKNGILKFQALWRGYTFRKLNDSKVVCALRERLQKVNRETKEEDKLYRRTSVAIEHLLTYKHLSYILAALQHLEVATRLSAVCCEIMARSRAVGVIFTLIRSCNRSIPCMEVIKLAVQVLLNLSKYEGTVQVVYEAERSVAVLLDLMQIYREKAGDKVSEKGGSIFTKACCLLAIFAQNTRRAWEIRSIPKAVDRIRSIYKLTSRKHMMDAERNVSKHRMSTSAFSKTHSSFLATPIRTKVVSRIKPDWVLRKDNMREIVDPLKAIRMVLDTLSIAL
uniref:Assembly factor for spindle microtubules n=1 Tax=Leptobrachium leishanense TaxID=445787 RepID=A0A8C5WK29_9ANUR